MKVFLVTLTAVLIITTVIKLPGAQATELGQAKSQAMALATKGDYDSALEFCDKAIAIARQEYGERCQYLSDLYFEKGVIAQESGKFQMAEDAYNWAISTNPNSPQSHMQLASLLAIRDRAQDSRGHVEKACALNQNSVAAKKHLANCYAQGGNQVKAIYEYAQAAKLAQLPITIATPRPQSQQIAPVQATEAPKSILHRPDFTNHNALAKPAEKTKPEPKPQAQAKTKPQPKTKAQTPQKQTNKPKKHEAQAKEKSASKPAKPILKPLQAKAAKPLELKAKAIPLKAAKSKGMGKGLVPPPPPVVPTFSGVVPPPPLTGAPPAPKPQAPPKTKEKPKVEAQEHKEPAKEEKSTHGGGQENPDFLLDWAGKKNK